MPNEKARSAIGEVMSLYIIPRIHAVFASESVPPLTDRARAAAFRKNLAYLEQAIRFIREQGASVLILHTPDRIEVISDDEPSDAVDYRPYRTGFMATAKRLDVPVIDLSHQWRGAPQVTQWFRDGVHLTAEGNKAAARTLAQTIRARKLLYPVVPESGGRVRLDKLIEEQADHVEPIRRRPARKKTAGFRRASKHAQR